MMPPGGQPPMAYAGGGAMAMPGNLANPWLRIVGGLIDFAILVVINYVIQLVLSGGKGNVLSGLVALVIDLAYFGYFWSQRGQSVGMMVFGFKVRDQATGQFPTPRKSVLRGFIWSLEAGFTVCLIGIVGWAWQLWDPQRQAIHDKIAGTIVTTS
jgi:uncharacterized RDD family membrane protein YckC